MPCDQRAGGLRHVGWALCSHAARAGRRGLPCLPNASEGRTAPTQT